jgi:hypothetical protein
MAGEAGAGWWEDRENIDTRDLLRSFLGDTFVRATRNEGARPTLGLELRLRPETPRGPLFWNPAFQLPIEIVVALK